MDTNIDGTDGHRNFIVHISMCFVARYKIYTTDIFKHNSHICYKKFSSLQLNGGKSLTQIHLAFEKYIIILSAKSL